MKIEHIILISIIALVIIIDFMSKKIKAKKTSIKDDITEVINDSSPVSKRPVWQSLLYSFLISLVISPSIYLINDFLIYSDFSKDNIKELCDLFFNDDILIALFYFFISFMTILFFLTYRNLQKIKVAKYFFERKKNIALFIVSMLALKVLINYFAYPVKLNNNITKSRFARRDGQVYREYDANFGHYIDNIFSINLDLFFYSFFVCLFFAWFFNNKIKAR